MLTPSGKKKAKQHLSVSDNHSPSELFPFGNLSSISTEEIVPLTSQPDMKKLLRTSETSCKNCSFLAQVHGIEGRENELYYVDTT